MAKDAFYFSHDFNARNDIKIVKLRRKYGLEGYGAYFCLLEMLRENENHKLHIEHIPDIAYELHISEELLNDVIRGFMLFEIEDMMFYSNSFLGRMDKYNELKAKRKEASRKAVEGRLMNQTLTKRDTIGLPLKESKVKESKVKKIESKEDIEASLTIKQKEFLLQVEGYLKLYPKEMIDKFCEYWTEPNKARTKLLWELEKTWDIGRRLKRWADNEKNFKKISSANTPALLTEAEIETQKKIERYRQEHGR